MNPKAIGLAGGLASAMLAFLLTLSYTPPHYAQIIDQYAELIDRFGVTEVRVTDRPCGRTDWRGCFDPAEPTVVQVSSRLSAPVLAKVLVHEVGHRDQYIRGVPLDECEADMFAADHARPTPAGEPIRVSFGPECAWLWE